MWIGLLALLIGQISGSSVVPIVTKIGLQAVPAGLFVCLRFLLASFLFFPIYLVQSKRKLSLQQIFPLLLLSFFLFVNVSSFTIGVQFTTVIMTQILYAATPIVVGVISHFFFDEKMTRQKIIGLIIALSGVLFLLYQSFTKQAHLAFGSPVGNIIVLIGMFGYSGYVIFSRKLQKTTQYSSYHITFFTFLFTSILLFILLPVLSLFSQTPLHSEYFASH